MSGIREKRDQDFNRCKTLRAFTAAKSLHFPDFFSLDSTFYEVKHTTLCLDNFIRWISFFWRC